VAYENAQGGKACEQHSGGDEDATPPRRPVNLRIPVHALEQVEFGDPLPDSNECLHVIWVTAAFFEHLVDDRRTLGVPYDRDLVTAALQPAQVAGNLGPHGRELHRAVGQWYAKASSLMTGLPPQCS
jgi:hypothetical protein